MATFGLVSTVMDSDDHGQVKYAVIQEADPINRVWLGMPHKRTAEDIAKLILAGHEVHTVFIDTVTSVLGPRVKVVRDQFGALNIALCPDLAGRTFGHLWLNGTYKFMYRIREIASIELNCDLIGPDRDFVRVRMNNQAAIVARLSLERELMDERLSVGTKRIVLLRMKRAQLNRELDSRLLELCNIPI